jgi:outer membrane immunogenic protein
MPVGKSSIAPALLAAMAIGLWSSQAAAGGAGKPPSVHESYGTTWNGIYVGGGLGSAWGEGSFVYTSGLAATPDPFDLDGAMAGGAHLGIQRQWGRIVVGLETSVLASNLDGQGVCPNPAFSCGVDLDWVWMVGPRLGVTASHLHFYGTGGYALGSLETRTAVIATGVTFDRGHDRHGGWYLGAGVEWSLGGSTVLGVEYRRIELDDALHISSTGLASENRSADAAIDTIQARLTFKLGR